MSFCFWFVLKMPYLYLFTGYLWATEVWFPLNFELSFKALSSLSLYHAVMDGFSQRAAVFMFDFYIYRWVKPRTENRLLQIVSNVESVSFWVISLTLWKIISGLFVFLSSKCCSQIVQNITFPVLKSLFNHLDGDLSVITIQHLTMRQ